MYSRINESEDEKRVKDSADTFVMYAMFLSPFIGFLVGYLVVYVGWHL